MEEEEEVLPIRSCYRRLLLVLLWAPRQQYTRISSRQKRYHQRRRRSSFYSSGALKPHPLLPHLLTPDAVPEAFRNA